MRKRERDMKKMRFRLLTTVVIIAALLSGCGSSSTSGSYKSATSDSYASADNYAKAPAAEAAYVDESYDMAMYDDSTTAGSGASMTTENATTSNRKLIRNASLSVETKEFDELLVSLDTKIKGMGGYIENMSGNYGSRYSSYRSSKSAYITARIPSSKLDEFINSVGETANITSKSESVTDITLEYVDMESHKKMLKEEQDRLLEFLDQAETIEDIITIEDRLTDVKYQLESMESQLRTYDNKIDYSTVDINIQEVIDYTVVVEEEKTPVERMKEGFAESIRNIGIGLREFGIWFVINLPYIVLLAIIALIVLIIIRAVGKRNKKKHEALMEEKAKRQAEAAARGISAEDSKAEVYVNKPGKNS